MTKVDFYVLPNTAVQERYLFACRLIEKAYRLGHKVFVYGSSSQQLGKLDQLLWSFKASSFIPHQLCSLESSSAANVEPINDVFLGTELPPENYHEVLINLSNQVPDFFGRFERVSEIVIDHDKIKTAIRANFLFYRERGYEVKTHQMQAQPIQ